MANQVMPMKAFFQQDAIQKKIAEVVGKNSATFTTTLLQIANGNKELAEAVPMTILQAGLMAAALKLPINQNLGFAYIVPYRQKINGEYYKMAQFQMGYKGFIQLAQRTGQFAKLVSVPVFQKQLISKDPINGYVFDWNAEPAPNEKAIGYYAYFKLINGFTAELYMTRAELDAHGKKYSQTYKKGFVIDWSVEHSPNEKPNGYYAFFRLINGFTAELYMTLAEVKKHGKRYSQSFQRNKGVWVDNFDAMARKTVIKLLLSQQAPLSIEMQQAVQADQAIINSIDGDFRYIDNESEQQQKADELTGGIDSPEREEIITHAEEYAKKGDLVSLNEYLTEERRKILGVDEYRRLVALCNQEADKKAQSEETSDDDDKPPF